LYDHPTVCQGTASQDLAAPGTKCKMEHDTATVTVPRLYLYLEAFLCMIMIDKKHSCIVDKHVQWKVQLMVLVCKGLDGPAAVFLCMTTASALNLPLQLAELQQLQNPA